MRAENARALAGAAALGSLAGLAIGAAYLAGGVARSAAVHAQASRLAAAPEGYSDTAPAGSADPAALAVAPPQDSAATAPAIRNDRLLGAAQVAQAPQSGLRSRLSTPTVTPAKPFRLRGAMNESRDLECLTQAVYYEARGETPAGQAAVAQVILNRTRHPAFPKTVCGVVFQRTRGSNCQFSFACDGSVHRRVESRAWRRAEEVAARALDGVVMAQVGNATHFHVTRVSPDWGARLLRVAQVGAHVFYRFGGRNGSAKAFNGTPEPSGPELTPASPAETPLYAASLSLGPIANSVATSVATSVSQTVAAGAELVMQATKPAQAAPPATGQPAAKQATPAAPAGPAPAAAPAPVAEAVMPTAPAAS